MARHKEFKVYLREMRLLKELSLSQVASHTGISEKYLEEMEQGFWTPGGKTCLSLLADAISTFDLAIAVDIVHAQTEITVHVWIDQVHGLDSNSGLVESAPVKTFDRATQAGMSDVVPFYRGNISVRIHCEAYP